MIEKAKKIAKKAGKILLKYYNSEFDVEIKKDKSPVTTADFESSRFIIKELKREFPHDEILSEEDQTEINYSKKVWIIDPLDGTKNFIKKGNDYCIIIGLCKNGEPVLGVVYNPIRKELFYAEKGKGAFLVKNNKTRRIKVNQVYNFSDAVLAERRGFEQIKEIDLRLNKIAFKNKIERGCFGTRLCSVASGESDISMCAIDTLSKWDTCGSQAIIEEAGGVILDIFGKRLNYKQKSNKWGKPVLAGNQILVEKVINKLK